MRKVYGKVGFQKKVFHAEDDEKNTTDFEGGNMTFTITIEKALDVNAVLRATVNRRTILLISFHIILFTSCKNFYTLIFQVTFPRIVTYWML